ncbi:MAG: hypothetical protein P8017_12340 [Deltaproteobacteria bacterium]
MVRYDRTIPPGGVGQVTLQVNTSGFQGKVTKSARVNTNDPVHRNSKIYLAIDVRAHIIVEPGPRILLQGIVGDDIQKVVHIRSAENQPFEITRIDTNLRSVIDYKLSRKDKNSPYTLKVTSKAAGEKTASGFLTLHTNYPKKKVLKLTVHLRVKPEIQVWPTRVDFYEESKSGSKKPESKRFLIVMNNRGKSFKIKELNYNKDYFPPPAASHIREGRCARHLPPKSRFTQYRCRWGWTPVGLLYLTTKTTKRMSVVRGQSLKSLKP